MNCKEFNQLDIVDYLLLMGYKPAKISGNDHWYFSPFRNEQTPSFKVNRKFLDRVKEWLKRHPHWDVWEQRKQLTSMLQGFYQYYALNHCARKLELVHMQVRRYWRHYIRRKSQRSKGNWSYLEEKKWFELPRPVTLDPNV